MKFLSFLPPAGRAAGRTVVACACVAGGAAGAACLFAAALAFFLASRYEPDLPLAETPSF